MFLLKYAAVHLCQFNSSRARYHAQAVDKIKCVFCPLLATQDEPTAAVSLMGIPHLMLSLFPDFVQGFLVLPHASALAIAAVGVSNQLHETCSTETTISPRRL